MPLQILRQDITKIPADAIVNPVHSHPGEEPGGVSRAIRLAAGEAYTAACSALPAVQGGTAQVTKGYGLAAKYVLHVKSPMWQGGDFENRQALLLAYLAALRAAKGLGCESVAFPLLSAGAHGFPREAALHIAVEAIRGFLREQDMDVTLAVFDKGSFSVAESRFPQVQAYIDDHYADARRDTRERRFRQIAQLAESAIPPPPMAQRAPMPCAASRSLEEALGMLDESFSQMVLRKIKELGMKNADCYKRANLDKKLFSKLANDVHYKPKKTTALAIAIALRLSLPETRELLTKAGYALSHSEKLDVIVEYFIIREEYDIFTINEVLFAYDQSLLGSF